MYNWPLGPEYYYLLSSEPFHYFLLKVIWKFSWATAPPFQYVLYHIGMCSTISSFTPLYYNIVILIWPEFFKVFSQSNVRRSEEPRHKSGKSSILWHSEFFDMLLYRSPKTAPKNTQNFPLYSILKLTFLDIFKNESFCFP